MRLKLLFCALCLRLGPLGAIPSFSQSTMKVKCPTCGREIEYSAANPFRPFCSERCKLIDLGAWANDEYLIEGEPGSAASLSEQDLEAAAENAVRRAEKIAAMADRLDAAKARRRKR